MFDEPKCPKCESTNWKCGDERIHRYEDMSEVDDMMRYFDVPVGYLRCKDCGCQWQDEDLSVKGQSHIIDITDEWNRED